MIFNLIHRSYFVILLLVSFTISILAQNNYYYHLGKKIPLTSNTQKVCLSIPKDKRETSDFILSKTKIQEIIQDERFDIYLIPKGDLDKLTKVDSWKEHKNIVLITLVYTTEDGNEVFSTPYLNVRLKNEQDICLLDSCSKKYGLDIVGPGDSIFSTVIDHDYGYMSGTSMACPHVAGVAALVLERNPELTATQVNSVICRNAQKLSGVNFNTNKPDGTWNEMFGYGLVDAYSSVLNTPSAIYIQNENVTDTEIISADSIYVGRNVTDRKQQGNVVLGPGSITLDAKKVRIKNSTTVPLGTTLKIGNHLSDEH